jgi:ribosomal protein RSM22 (predicted rRNA methylase)
MVRQQWSAKPIELVTQRSWCNANPSCFARMTKQRKNKQVEKISAQLNVRLTLCFGLEDFVQHTLSSFNSVVPKLWSALQAGALLVLWERGASCLFVAG